MSEDSTSDDRGDVPPWWEESVEIREELDLPGYDAPKFEDGVYVHTVVEKLESRYDCQIQFVDPSPSEVSRWEIRVDGQPIDTVFRTRDVDANTVFQVDADEFETIVADAEITSRD
ncbi:hypothetical protein [Haloarcula amylovorans]|uniref:hypothetical protein n=1 Tax=Haloarcula amylovorans TaxID=2562280 RepID=UPI0010764ACE|nr:hypothetical protein [Halomicroarcula amylolytica]